MCLKPKGGTRLWPCAAQLVKELDNICVNALNASYKYLLNKGCTTYLNLTDQLPQAAGIILLDNKSLIMYRQQTTDIEQSNTLYGIKIIYHLNLNIYPTNFSTLLLTTLTLAMPI